jgi:hypothetical protein
MWLNATALLRTCLLAAADSKGFELGHFKKLAYLLDLGLISARAMKI